MKNRTIIRRWILFFIVALVISGATAIPVESELNFLTRVFPLGTGIGDWLDRVLTGFTVTKTHYPFLAYGYDWLAFAHFVLAVLFIGPLKDPIRNKWVIEFGLIACVLVIPYAMIAGSFRGIPLGWRLIDCSFGAAGLVPLGIVLKKIKRIESSAQQQSHED
ncbi:MAG: hypothetical protein HYZ15_00670 [Sphingobacteriales bacterium]|nr:hypothetical protein [Sphingobacteriales bacterium]